MTDPTTEHGVLPRAGAAWRNIRPHSANLRQHDLVAPHAAVQTPGGTGIRQQSLAGSSIQDQRLAVVAMVTVIV